MNAIQLHLVLSHVPVIGLLFASALFIYGVAKKNIDMQRFSLGAFVALAVLTLPVYFSGDAVEEVVEALPGISDDLVEPHEEAAGAALIGMELLGAAALAGLIAFRRRSQLPRGFLQGVLGLTTVASLLMVWTAHRGGQIRHTELTVASQLIVPPGRGYLPHDASEREAHP
ncbi:MAG: hypothetical protein A2992_02220 [Elusimicrobia bacterium RIFCSPLOWO2_01_FULL_59_12]|nr:MAG: hypothetical protein A2992_02220 [Elusimicrobia bacterium RIFCSPLOWO2_01_FULL_59_12]